MVSASIQLLGDVSVTRPGAPSAVLGRRQPRAVLALLASERHRSVTRAEIAEVLWSEDLPGHWAGAVRGVVSKLRSFLDRCDAGEWLVTTPVGWRLELPDDVVVDVEVAVAAVEAAEAADQGDGGADGRTPAALIDDLVAADRALRTELAPGTEGTWIDERREALARMHRRCLAALTVGARRVGLSELAVVAARDLAALDPFSDATARSLIGALHAAGDRTGALRAFDEFDQLLRHEVGVEPEEQTAKLAREIRGLSPPAPSPSPLVPGGPIAPLVGRRTELAVLRGAWHEVMSGRGARAVLLTGEPGAGKTRLAAEATAWVDRGRVLWGRCSPERRVSFEPVVEALARVLDRDRSPLDALGVLAAELRPILPEHVPVVSGVPTADAAVRSQLFRAITAALRAAVTAPSVWVIDDLHWANEDTVALLDHLATGVADLDLLMVLTSRGHGAGVASMLSDVARSMPMETVALGGLDTAGVTDLLARAGVRDPGDLGELVRERTGGNPFFIGELVRSVDADGGIDPRSMPPTIRSWIDQRVAALEEGSADTLHSAAVLGAQVDLDVLATLLDEAPLDVLVQCRALLDGGLLVEPADTDDADLAFAHALTREAVYDGLGPAKRRVLHGRAADALRRVRPHGPAAELATHLAAAGPSFDDEAVAAMVKAGDEALAGAAWGSADQWFIQVLERRPRRDEQRVRALIGLGSARRGLGQREGARDALAEALDTARNAGWERLAALATLGLVGGGARGASESLPDEERARLLRTALDGLEIDGNDDVRVPLEVELALALLLSDHVEERTALATDALSRARDLGRPDLLGSALLGHRVARPGPQHAEARLHDIDEILAIDPPARPPAVTIGALVARHEDHLLRGDRTSAREALADARVEAEASGHPYWRWVVATWEVLGLIIDGDLEDAEPRAFEALGYQADHPEAMACLGVELVAVRLFQERAGEMVDLLGSAADENPHIPCYRAVLALCLADSGAMNEAGRHYRRFADTSFTTIPDDTNRLLAMAALADVAATLGDRSGASDLLEILAPHHTRQVVLNCFAGGGAYWGPVATQLGRLAAVLGDEAAAADHFARARESAASFGAPLALARIPASP